jgi:hypothetical protein
LGCHSLCEPATDKGVSLIFSFKGIPDSKGYLDPFGD